MVLYKLSIKTTTLFRLVTKILLVKHLPRSDTIENAVITILEANYGVKVFSGLCL